MRAYLIDPAAETITPVEATGRLSGPGGAYAWLGIDIVDIAAFNAAGDLVLVDDEGLLRPGPLFLFQLTTTGSTLAGRGLVVGPEDADGHFTAPTVTFEAVRAAVRFLGAVSGADRPPAHSQVYPLDAAGQRVRPATAPPAAASEADALPTVGPMLTDAQAQAILDWVAAEGPKRKAAQGRAFCEADYLAGVMTTLFALDRADAIPISWVIEVLTGREVFLPHFDPPMGDDEDDGKAEAAGGGPAAPTSKTRS